MTTLAVSPTSLHIFHPFTSSASSSSHRPSLRSSSSTPRSNSYSSQPIPSQSRSTPTSPRLSPTRPDAVSNRPVLPAPSKVVRKTPSTSAIQATITSSVQPMPALPLTKNRQRAPTLPTATSSSSHAFPRERDEGDTHRQDESFLPFEPSPSSPGFRIDRRRTRKHSHGGFFSSSSSNHPAISPLTISNPSSTIRLSSDPTKASAQLGFKHGYPITPPDLPSIHGVFDNFDAGPANPSKVNHAPSASMSGTLTKKKAAKGKPAPIDTSGVGIKSHATIKKKRDTLRLPMMSPPDSNNGQRSATSSRSSPRHHVPTDGEIDMSEWDMVSVQSIPYDHAQASGNSAQSSLQSSSRHSSSRSLRARAAGQDPSPVPSYAKYADWVDPDGAALTHSPVQLSAKRSPAELDLKAIEVLEHFSGHLLKDGWNAELEEYGGQIPTSGPRTLSPKTAPALPAKSRLRNQQQQPRRPSPPTPADVRAQLHGQASATNPPPMTASGQWTRPRNNSPERSRGREDFDGGSMRSWREARKRSKPPVLRPLSEQPPKGSNRLAPPSTRQGSQSPIPPSRTSSLTPAGSDAAEVRDGPDGKGTMTQLEDLSASIGSTTASGMRKVSSALSRLSSDEKRRPKVKVPLVLDSRSSQGMSTTTTPSSPPVPIQHRPLPPLPPTTTKISTGGPSRSNSSGPAALLQFRLNRSLLRPKRPSTAPFQPPEAQDAAEAGESGMRTRLAARDEPHPGSPLSPRARPDAADKRNGMTALSFLAMNEPDSSASGSRSNGHTVRGSMDWREGEFMGSEGIDMSPLVKHILPPAELSKLMSPKKERRHSWSSSASGSSSTSTPDQTLPATGASPLDKSSVDEGGRGDGSGTGSMSASHTLAGSVNPQSPSNGIRKSISIERDRSKRKRADKLDHRTSSASAHNQTLSPIMSLSDHPWSPVSPLNALGGYSPASKDEDEDEHKTRITALPPPPRPRYSFNAKKDLPLGSNGILIPEQGSSVAHPVTGGRVAQGHGHVFMSTPPTAEGQVASILGASTSTSRSGIDRPQTFMALSPTTSTYPTYNNIPMEGPTPITTRPTSPTSQKSSCPPSPISPTVPLSAGLSHGSGHQACPSAYTQGGVVDRMVTPSPTPSFATSTGAGATTDLGSISTAGAQAGDDKVMEIPPSPVVSLFGRNSGTRRSSGIYLGDVPGPTDRPSPAPTPTPGAGPIPNQILIESPKPSPPTRRGSLALPIHSSIQDHLQSYGYGALGNALPSSRRGSLAEIRSVNDTAISRKGSGGPMEDAGSFSTTATSSRRELEREERDKALKEWLRMKPRRGTVGQ